MQINTSTNTLQPACLHIPGDSSLRNSKSQWCGSSRQFHQHGEFSHCLYRWTKAVFPNVMLPVTQFVVVFDFEGGEV